MISTLVTLSAGLLVAMIPPADAQPAKPAETKPAETKVADTKPAAKPAAKPVPAAPELHPLEARIIEKTNAERVRHGLPALAVDPGLIKSARQHAAWMTNTRNMVHTNKPVAENIAMGQRNSGEVLNAWMNSSGHRANILNPGHRRIGVAAFMTPNGTVFWCQQFLH